MFKKAEIRLLISYYGGKMIIDGYSSERNGSFYKHACSFTAAWKFGYNKNTCVLTDITHIFIEFLHKKKVE